MTEYLTNEEFQRLPVGTVVKITWSGGNGPARYVVEQDRFGQKKIMSFTLGSFPYNLGPPEPDGRHINTAVEVLEYPESYTDLINALHTAFGYRDHVGPQRWATWEDCWDVAKKLLEKYDPVLYREIYGEVEDKDMSAFMDEMG